jgi:hypothetical protein
MGGAARGQGQTAAEAMLSAKDRVLPALTELPDCFSYEP